MWVMAFFTNDSGVPVEALTPLVRIRNISTGALAVNDATMSGIGDGFYVYDFTIYSPQIDYSIRCDSITISGTGRYTYTSNSELASTVDDINTTVESISTTVSGIDVRTILTRKVLTNKLELEDGSTDNWILYDDDSTTPLLTFSVSDKTGAVISQSPNTPSRRTKGV